MKRFRFRLEGLLRLRRLQERQARRQLADALRALRQLETVCQLARRAVREAEGQVLRAQDARELRGWAEAMQRRRQELAAAERARVAASRHAEELWARFLQLRRDRKGVEQVRERRWRLHQREQVRREQAELDELALLRRRKRA